MWFGNRSSLVSQLSLRVFLLSLIAFAGILLTAFSGMVISSLNAHNMLANQAADIAHDMDIRLQKIVSDVEITTNVLGNTNNTDDVMRHLLQNNDSIYSLFLIDRNGRVIYQRQRIAADVALGDAVTDWLSYTNTYLSGVYSLNDTPFMDVIVPIYQNTPTDSVRPRRQATLVARIDLSTFWELIIQAKVPKNGYAYLMNRDGRLLAYQDLRIVQQGESVEDLTSRTPDQLLAFQGVFQNIYVGIENRWVVSGLGDLRTVEWYVIIEQPLMSLAQSFYLPFALSLLVLTAIILLIFTILGFMRRRVVKPLTLLQNEIEQFQKGDLTRRIHLSKNLGDEIDMLAQTFNHMADNIENRTQELLVANAKAIESSRLKTEFLSVVSHELRTPLNAVMGYTGILLEGIGGNIDDDAKKMVERIDSNSQRLLTLINEILEVSRIEAGEIEIERIPFIPKELVQMWDKQVHVLLDQKSLVFEVFVDDNLPDVLYGDPNRITQVVMNLLANAIKFTQDGFVQLTVAYSTTEWTIIVTDSGIGIPEHSLTFIFDRFRQVNSSTTREYGGTGLGLAIVRDLTQLMGGRVTVQSVYGEGSTFTVFLPVLLDDGESKATNPNPQSPANENASH